MLAILSAYDETEKNGDKDKVGFIHLISCKDDEIRIEASPYALALARKFNLEKVYLFYGKEKIVYDYSLQSKVDEA